MSLLVTASIAGIIMVSLGVVTQQEARDAVQWDLFVVVACAFGVANAMINSGVAEGLASFFVLVGKALKIGGKFATISIRRRALMTASHALCCLYLQMLECTGLSI